MTRLLFLLISIFSITIGFSQQPDSILHSANKPTLINPYKNLKTSVFARGQSHGTLGWGYGGGIEFRRFISLKEYIFFEVSFTQWQRSKSVDNYYGQECSYDFKAKSVSVKLGKAIFGSQHIYIGAFFLTDTYLSEEVPAQHLQYSNDEYVTVSGNITPYVRQVVPIVGYSMKLKGWRFMFFEVGVDYIFFNSLKPVYGNWRVPDRVSGFILAQKNNDNFYNIYGSIHFKL